MSPAAIQLSDVTVTYHRNTALRGVSLSVAAGEFLGILGPNGAGKTTLLTVVNGLGRIRSGSVRLFGETVTGRNIRRWRREIGYVPQELAVDPRVPMDSFEAVLIGVYGKLGVFRRVGAAERARAGQLMEFFRIAHLRGRPVGQVSGGELQKLALARALLPEPKILLLDEPTANLDPRSVQEVLELLGAVYRRFRLTVLFVTHRIDHLPPECKRVVLLRQGRIFFDGDRERGLSPEMLAGVFS